MPQITERGKSQEGGSHSFHVSFSVLYSKVSPPIPAPALHYWSRTVINSNLQYNYVKQKGEKKLTLQKYKTSVKYGVPKQWQDVLWERKLYIYIFYFLLLVAIIPWRSWGNHGHKQASESTKGLLLLVALIFSELFKMEGPPWRLGQYPEGWHSREDYWSLRICFQCSTSAHMIHATIPAPVPIKGPFCRATKTAVAFRPTWGDFEVVWWHNAVTDHMEAFITS